MAEGRGRLSSLDQLPDEAQDDLVWAMAELNQRKRSQAEILDELNGRLADKSLVLISRSAFNRKAMRVAQAGRRVDEARAIYEGIAPRVTPDQMDQSAIVIGELIKVLISELLDRDQKSFTPSGAKELASAYKAAIEAQAISGDLKRRMEAEFSAKVGAAVEKVAKAKGITADTRHKIMEQLGVIQRSA